MPASFTAILPKRKNASDITRKLALAMQGIAADVRQDFQSTTATWQTSVQWVTKNNVNQSEIKFQVYTENQIYNWVSKGTGAQGSHNAGAKWYPIYPVRGKRLAFQSEFSPKTHPGVIESTQGGKSGPLTVLPFTMHPGIKGRLFDVTIRDKWEPLLKARLERVFSEIAQALG